MGKYLVHSTKTEKVDRETGEIIKSTKSVSVIKREAEPFFLTYSKEIMALYGQTIFNATTKVLWKLLEYAEYNTGKVYMNAQRTKEIMQECNIGRSSYYRAIDELKNADIISGDKSTFTIAENMFWKGDRKSREHLKTARLRVTFDLIYDEDDKTITLMQNNGSTIN